MKSASVNTHLKRLEPEAVFRFMLLIVAGFVLAGIMSALLNGSTIGWMGRVMDEFELDASGVIPAWYLSTLCLGAAVLAWINAQANRECEFHIHRWWFGLTAILVLLSLDKYTGYHAEAGRLGVSLGVPGGWLLPAIVISLVLGFLFVPLLRSLPSQTRHLLVLGGLLYAVGAIGFEVFGRLAERGSAPPLAVELVGVGETGVEMLGLSVAVYAMWLQLWRYSPVENSRPDGSTDKTGLAREAPSPTSLSRCG